MRASAVVSVILLAATAGAAIYFGGNPFSSSLPRSGQSPGKPGTAASREPRQLSLAPQGLSELAAFLREVPFDQRGQFVRERIAVLSPEKPADREAIRAFLRSGVDVEIEHSGIRQLPLSAGHTTMRRYLLGLLEKFPAQEAVPLAREVLAGAVDFRESYLCLRALEAHQPDANRAEAAAAMQRALATAAKPVRDGQATSEYLAQFDRIAEPIAHYGLVELHPQAIAVVKANPMLAGRYTQAIESFPAAQQAAAYDELFSAPEAAGELVNSAGMRSANAWTVPAFRTNAAKYFAAQMSNRQREAFLAGLAEDSGLHYSAKPLAAPSEPVLMPTDPAADALRAEGRLAMVEAVLPHATAPEVKKAADETAAALRQEIAERRAEARASRTALIPATLPVPTPFGAPAGSADAEPVPPEEQEK